jgi:hypothetical protein
MMAKPKYRPISDVAEELAKTAGSLTHAVSGTVWRASSIKSWDMQNEWHGQELVCYTVRHSTWGDSTRIALYDTRTPSMLTVPAFYVHIDGKLTEEETAQMAEVYMMALNLRRVE